MTDREVIYTIGGRKAKSEMVGQSHLIRRKNGSPITNNYGYHIWFGIDKNGTRYMVLSEPEKDRFWHGAYRSCGHWHSSGFREYIKYWKIYKRKNFKNADEANRYFLIVTNNMENWRVEEDREFSEEQFDLLFDR